VFAPPSITASGTPSIATPSITVTTKAATAKLRSGAQSYFLAQWIAGLGLMVSMVFVGGKRQSTRGLFLVLTLILLVVSPGCGGGGSHGPPPDPGTPSGNYNVKVTATSGATVSSSGFFLVVQ
jgi:hypothetical protein